ncbi:glycoside hydrolase family 3 protein [Rhodovulum tesquicola]|uniref:beta-N-acetylhexosaminidase n=1 Tax=Rhodovulum steppense TaxID=540251 RepID=A0A4R1YGL4_9RHOB|nr:MULTISPECIES: glycoside hydrolase family 3 N-terminal domain-containing protein [Rhodovulum]MCO8144499.1 glycoside hydrolase family 3 protein [Rhodovulum tesquicola]TCM75257.1 beta-N-acetylhexosaminidase [Rhodovulum steppense]
MRRAGAYILGCSGPALTAAERQFFAQANPLGFILFARNVRDPSQLRALTESLRAAVGRAAPILIDQEGGRVQRLTAPHWRQWAAAADQIAAVGPENAARSMYLRSRLIARELNWAGIDVNCAPLGDLARPETHKVLKNRCYGSDPASVARIARAVADGLLHGGVLPVLKHIPGHGRATVDSHLDLPRVKTPLSQLEATDFAAFRALSDLPLGMTAHVVYEALDGGAPVTTSGEAIIYIRRALGFQGFLMTDDISMQALSGSIAARCVASIRAGCDAVLHCNGKLAEMEEVAEASGTLTEKAAARASRALARRRPPVPGEVSALVTELDALLGKRRDA